MRAAIILPIISSALSAASAATLSSNNVVELATGTKSTRTNECTEKKTRVEWRDMEEGDKLDFVNSIACLMKKPPSGVVANATNRYDELVAVHYDMGGIIHNSGYLLNWHRYFVHGFETLLRDECGYDAPFPWWEETRDTGNFADSGLFTSEYFGALPEVDGVTQHGFCTTDGAFANRTCTMGFSNPRCLSRGEDKVVSAIISPANLASCNAPNITTYRQVEHCLGGVHYVDGELASSMHIAGHGAVGPIMSDFFASPNDPIFFMHHGFLDWAYARWQNADPENRFDEDKFRGCYYPGDSKKCVPMPLDTVLTTHGVIPDMTVRDVLNPNKGPLCYEYNYY